MIQYDPASIDDEPFDLIGAILTWSGFVAILAIYLATIPFAGRQYAGRSKSNRDAINLHERQR